ncbi:MAG: hypothetical protein QG640_438 [Patescibacteria group bacterium]|nr:hypothetical protein [Patescibacteria group bacterium]
MTTVFFALFVCAGLYIAISLKRFAKNENDWHPVKDVMIASQFPSSISDSGQLMAFPQYDCEFFSFHSDGMVETPFLITPSHWRHLGVPYDWLDPTEIFVHRCFHNTVSR